MAIFNINSIASALGQLEQKQVLYPLAQEVLGSNIPKTVVTRNRDEMIDVASGQFGGTVAFFTSGLILNKVLDKALKLLNKGNVPAGSPAQRWGILGKSLAMYAVQGGLYWAVPFARNYMTTKRTGVTNFKDIINQNGNVDEAKKPSQKELDEALSGYKSRIVKILGAGSALAAGLFGASAVMAKRGVAPGKLASGAMRYLSLGQGDFKNFPRAAQFLVIAVGSYAGWIDAVRDKFEMKEQLLQFASFVFGFFVPPVMMERLFKGKMENLLRNEAPELVAKVIGKDASGNLNKKLVLSNIEKHLASSALLKPAKKLFVKQTVAGLAVSAVLLSALPQLINRVLTKKRIADEQDVKPVAKQPAQPSPFVLQPAPQPVMKKSFERFSHSA